MGFHINTNNMPVIKNYEQAKREFESRTAIRGGDQSIRRLGARYEKEKWLRKDMLDGIEVYTAGYYNSDLVRYYPTHMEFTLADYPSLSTQLFIQGLTYTISFWKYYPEDFVPKPFSHEANRGIETRVTLYRNREVGIRYINSRSWYKVYYDGRFDDNDDYITPKKFKVDRKRMKEITNRYQPFLKYADSLIKLNSDHIGNDPETLKYINKQITSGDNYTSTWILKSALDKDEWWYTYYALARETYSSVFNHNNREWESKITLRGMKRFIYDELKKRSSYVLVEVA